MKMTTKVGGMKMITMISFILLSLLITIVQSESYNPSRTKLIDSTTPTSGLNNFLFRGNEPLDTNNNFAYSQLNQTFHQLVPDMPNVYYLIDVCLLWKGELLEENHEQHFFHSNPSLGQYLNYPIWGNILAVSIPLY